MPKAAPVPKPKIDWRLWIRVAAWAAVFVGAAWSTKELHAFLIADPRFELRCAPASATCPDLEVRGAVYANKARVRAVFSDDFGKSVFDLPLAERRRHLLAIDWVKTAAISRLLPNKLVVTLTERTPVAFAKLPMGNSGRNWMGLIDDEGVLMGLPQRVRFHLPVISGITESQTDEQRTARVKAMQHLLEDLGPDAKSISEVNAANVQEMRVIADVGGNAVELWLGDQHNRQRFLNFVSHYSDIKAHSEQATVFDLRLDDRILAR
jgi:cell division protein FtsQ